MDTQNEPLEALPNDNDLMAAAMAIPDDDPPAGEPQGSEGTAAAAPPATQESEGGEPEPGPFDLDALRKIAADRRAQREPPKPEPAAPVPDLAQLADHMSGAGEMRAAVDAFKTGDASLLSKVTGIPEATLFETWSSRVMKGEAVTGMEQKLDAALAEIEALKSKKPEGVMTEERYAQIQQAKARDEAYATFRNAIQDVAKYPILGNIASDTAVRYGDRAADLLREADKPLTLESIGSVAEGLAKSELGGLMKAQQETGHTVADGGHSEAAATSANTPSRRVGELDNRAAAEAASTLPDFSDESAYIERAMRAAEAE